MILTLSGFVACALMAAALVILGNRDRAHIAPLADLLDQVMATRAARLAILVFWWWLGWHFFVARTVDPVPSF
jgi:Mn2+/Fe2+ NRAMP family transporter